MNNTVTVFETPATVVLGLDAVGSILSDNIPFNEESDVFFPFISSDRNYGQITWPSPSSPGTRQNRRRRKARRARGGGR